MTPINLPFMMVTLATWATPKPPPPDTCDVAYELPAVAPLAVRVDKVCHVHPKQKPAFG